MTTSELINTLKAVEDNYGKMPILFHEDVDDLYDPVFDDDEPQTFINTAVVKDRYAI